MVRSVRHVPRCARWMALTVVVVLGAGCDFLGIGAAEVPRPSFTVANDLAVRTAVLGEEYGEAPSATSRAVPSVSLTPVLKVRPPTVNDTRTQAGHLSYDPETGHLAVAYKLAGSDFGGAIDVIGVQPGAAPRELVRGRRSLRSSNVDVVEVKSHPGEDTLYVAGAVTTRKRGVSPAVVSKIVPGEAEVSTRSKRLSHNVAKSVVLGPAPNTVHVATDENALFQLDRDLKNQTKRTVDNSSGFRSAIAHGDRVVVLDRSGWIFRTDANAFQRLSPVVRLTQSRFGNGTVARLHSDGDRLYAALNEKGFALVAPSGEATWQSPGVAMAQRYTCISTGPDYLYAGRFDGTIEVYRRPDAIPEQLEQVGTFGPWGNDYGAGDLSGAPINQIVVIEDHLYVANSRDGMVVLRIEAE